MRFALIGLSLIFCASLVAHAGEEAGEEVSVLVVDAAPPAAAAPVVAAADCDCVDCNCAVPVVTVRARTRYRAVTEGCDTCTGRPVRNVTRGVVRGTGAAVQRVGETAYNVITFPARVCRNGRCN